MTFIIIIFFILALYQIFEPNVEKNVKTGEYLLFYSIPFSKFVSRKYIKIW